MLYRQLQIYFIVLILLCAIVLKRCVICHRFFFIIHHWQHKNIYIYIFDIVIVNVSHPRFQDRAGLQQFCATSCSLVTSFSALHSSKAQNQRVFSIFTRGCLRNSGAIMVQNQPLEHN